MSGPPKEDTEGHRLTAGCDFSAGGDESVLVVFDEGLFCGEGVGGAVQGHADTGADR